VGVKKCKVSAPASTYQRCTMPTDSQGRSLRSIPCHTHQNHWPGVKTSAMLYALKRLNLPGEERRRPSEVGTGSGLLRELLRFAGLLDDCALKLAEGKEQYFAKPVMRS